MRAKFFGAFCQIARSAEDLKPCGVVVLLEPVVEMLPSTGVPPVRTPVCRTVAVYMVNGETFKQCLATAHTPWAAVGIQGGELEELIATTCREKCGVSALLLSVSLASCYRP